MTTTECIEWEGALRNGYGVHRVPGQSKVEYAHRTAFMAYYGPISQGMFICHTCDNKKCYNPLHLFAGSQSDNMQDAASKGLNHQTRKTHCPQGHEYDESNTRIYREMRYCRSCKKERRHG